MIVEAFVSFKLEISMRAAYGMVTFVVETIALCNRKGNLSRYSKDKDNIWGAPKRGSYRYVSSKNSAEENGKDKATHTCEE